MFVSSETQTKKSWGESESPQTYLGILNTMTYGNIHIKPPSLYKEGKEALKDLLDKGIIDQAEYSQRLREINREFLQFIAVTNDFRPRKNKGQHKNLSTARQQFMEDQSMQIAQQLSANLELQDSTEEAAEEATT